ncbi:MAG: hypothetical protein MUD08_17235 [Cytophagales bacterium]|jgi:hypothetical protein|nr:hypothetical protein [Cytophagales bacterium]
MENYASETELIDRYLKGELDVAARLQVEERLTHDAEFRQDVELQRELNRQLRLYNRLEMKKALQELHAQHAHEWTDEGEPSGVQGKGSVRRFRPWMWAAAASVLLAVAGWWQFARIVKTDRPLSLTARVPVFESTNGLGFGQLDSPTDSVPLTVRIGTDSTYIFQPDTLIVYLQKLPNNLSSWSVIYNPETEQYILRVSSTAYSIEKGFASPRPLRPVR